MTPLNLLTSEEDLDTLRVWLWVSFEAHKNSALEHAKRALFEAVSSYQAFAGDHSLGRIAKHLNEAARLDSLAEASLNAAVLTASRIAELENSGDAAATTERETDLISECDCSAITAMRESVQQRVAMVSEAFPCGTHSATSRPSDVGAA